jgi:hypothetical protein
VSQLNVDDIVSVVVAVGGKQLNHSEQLNFIEWRDFPPMRTRSKKNAQEQRRNWLCIGTSLVHFNLDAEVKKELFEMAQSTAVDLEEDDLLTELGTQGYWRVVEEDILEEDASDDDEGADR